MKAKNIFWSKFIFFIYIVGCSHVPSQVTYRHSSGNFFKPQTEREILGNGLEVWYLQENTLPSLTVEIAFRHGSVADPRDKSGLTSLSIDLVREEPLLRDALESLGSKQSVEVTPDYVTWTINSLSEFEEQLIPLVANTLMNPRFGAKEFEIMKKRYIERRKSLSDNLQSLAYEGLKKYFYGQNIYALPSDGNIKSLSVITLNDVNSKVQELFQPSGMVIGVSGALTPDIRSRVQKAFSLWRPVQSTKSLAQYASPVARSTPAQTIFFDKPGFTQVAIAVGYNSVPRSEERYIPLRVANPAIGQGWSNRLLNRLRHELGYVYWITSKHDSTKMSGLWSVTTLTRNEKAVSTVSEIVQIMEKVCRQGLTEEEVEQGKNYVYSRWVADIGGAEDVVDFSLAGELSGAPVRFYESIEKTLENTDVQAVNRSLRSIDCGHPHVVIVGDQKKVKLDGLTDVQIENAKTLY